MMKEDSSEQAGIVETERLSALSQDEVVVLACGEIGSLDAKEAGHAEMNAQPTVARKAKQDLFAAGFGSLEGRAGKTFDELHSIAAPEGTFLCMNLDREDALPEATIPASPIILDFSKLRHAGQHTMAERRRKGAMKKIETKFGGRGGI